MTLVAPSMTTVDVSARTKRELSNGYRSLIAPVDESTLHVDEYVVGAPFWIARRHVNAWGAKRGSHKTTLAVSLGVHVAAGLPWLGATDVCRGRVLYLDYEGISAQVRKVRDESLAGMSLEYPAIAASINSDSFRVVQITAYEKACGRYLDQVIEEMIREVAQDYTLIIVDGFGAAFHEIDNNDGQQVAARMQDLLRLAQESQAAVLFLDHLPKSATDRLTLTGSGKKEDLVRSLHFIKKAGDNGGRWVPEKVSFAETPPAFNFTIHRGDGILSVMRAKAPQPRGSNTVGRSPSVNRRPPRPEDVTSGAAVIAVLTSHGLVESKAALEDALAKHTGYKASTVRALLAAHKVLELLDESGLIVIEPSDADSRRLTYRLTAQIVR